MLNQTLASRYTLTAHIGSGAMGTVYRATDSQTGDEVAVKVLNRELAFSPELLERFRREGEALRQLRHPNIVGLVDTFQLDPDPSGGAGGQQVIVMECVAGGSLHSLIKQGPLPADRARKIALGLCDALTRAHDLGIIHRDIKPENILVAADGTPKLTDFGIARLLTEGTRITHSGVQVGTPYYMSPEAWEGKPLDAQADIWSLGIVLFEMLAGEVPFPGDTVIAVMHKVLTAPLPDLKQTRPDAPEGFAQIVHRMMTRDKAVRYPSMRQVAADLERGAPTAVPVRPPARPARRIPGWAWAAIIGVVLLGGIVIAGGQVWGPLVASTPTSQGAIALVSLTATPTSTVSQAPRPSRTPWPTVLATSTPLRPTATIDADPLVYDNFDNPEFDRAFNLARWIRDDRNSNVIIAQQGGELVISITPVPTFTYGNLYFNAERAPITSPSFVQMRIRVDDDHVGTSFVGTSIDYTTALGSYWMAKCGLGADDRGSQLSCVVESGDDNEPEFDRTVYVQFNQWYTLRVEIDPETFAISFFLDDVLFDTYVPNDAGQLKKAFFDRRIDAWADAGSGMTTHVDDVRMSP